MMCFTNQMGFDANQMKMDTNQMESDTNQMEFDTNQMAFGRICTSGDQVVTGIPKKPTRH